MRFKHVMMALIILLFVSPSVVYACTFTVAYVESEDISNPGVTLETPESLGGISMLTVVGIDSPKVFFDGNDMESLRRGGDKWIVLSESGTLEVRSDNVVVYRATIGVRTTGGNNSYYFWVGISLIGMAASVIVLAASFLPFIRSKMSKKSAKILRILMIVLFVLSFVSMYFFSVGSWC